MNTIFRVPIDASKGFTVRTESRFNDACKSIGIEFLDQLTVDKLHDLREKFKEIDGVGEKSLREFDAVMSEGDEFNSFVSGVYFDHWAWEKNVMPEAKRVIEMGHPLPNFAARSLLALCEKLQKK